MAGGLGTRMKSATPKHLHPLLGRRMVDWVLASAEPLGADPVVVVCSPQTEEAMRASLDGMVTLAVQQEARGTGDAVASARAALDGFDGDVLVLSGDTPMLRAELLTDLVESHRADDAAATILAIEPEGEKPYGRIVRNSDGSVKQIVEDLDATAEQRAIRELNSSIYVFRARDLWPAIDGLDAHNAQGELYLTDAIEQLVDAGLRVGVHTAPDPIDAEGVNTRVELAEAAAVLRDRINTAHMLGGVAIVDPASTWIDPDVVLEADSTIHPFTVLRGRSRVAAGAEIGPHAVLIDAEVGEGALVGPFCYLRPGTRLAAGAKAGTFVEIKNSEIGEGTKVPHLSYIGDAELGAGSNLGAGTITANFPHQPGRPKGRTRVGDNVRTGIHTSLMAPVEIGDDSWIAAGSVITDDVPPESLAGFPPRQTTKEGYLRGDDD
jgi:bifunctional UDP-N-acetylglucosamine pyrophosphorylase / glucosamine-1-phosphate N-acetyltransferase